MIWFLIWFVLSAIILGTFGWSTIILMRQKKAWKTFADKYSFTFEKGKFLAPPTMTGFIDEYRISFFTAERQDDDIRGRRYMTGMEVLFPEGFFKGGVAGTGEMITFMQTLTLLKSYKIDHENWDKSHRVYIFNSDVMDAYLTPERLDALMKMLGMKNADVLLMFDEREAVIRIETTDPMQDPEKMNRICQKIIERAKILTPSQEEQKKLQDMIPA